MYQHVTRRSHISTVLWASSLPHVHVTRSCKSYGDIQCQYMRL